MTHEFRLERRVEFADTDMAGIMHFANYFRLMEAAEHAFFRSLGLSLHGEAQGETYDWVRVHAECKYVRPLRYPDLVEIRLRVIDKDASSLSYGFEFRRTGEPELEPCARGSMRVAHVVRESGAERMRPAGMPEEVSNRIGVAPSAR